MNTVFVRLEGPLQCWRAGEKFWYRETNHIPTKSGVMGMLCACLGLNRPAAAWLLPDLNSLSMGVRVDRTGEIIEDYHTAQNAIRAGEGSQATSETVRQYIADASFLVALQGQETILERVIAGLREPAFTPYLGAKCCAPSRPLLAGTGDYSTLAEALQSQKWERRNYEENPQHLDCVIEVPPAKDAKVVNDVLLNLDPLQHGSRCVQNIIVPITEVEEEKIILRRFKPNRINETARKNRFKHDHYLCVVCQLPASEAHHVTYERAGHEELADLRSVCEWCHKAITTIEYDFDLPSSARLDPLDAQWRSMILDCRDRFIAEVM